MHHAYVIESELETGIAVAEAWVTSELGLSIPANPDVMLMRYGLLAVDEVRKLQTLAIQAPLRGDTKVLIIAAARLYHESQNALLKLFEEPTQGTYLLLVVPSIGMLLPTLRSRVQVLSRGRAVTTLPEVATAFIHASGEKRSALIKKLVSGSSEEERRAHRDQTIALVNGLERAALGDVPANRRLLEEIAVLRDYLHDRSAPLKMILEHLAIVTPRDLPVSGSDLVQ